MTYQVLARKYRPQNFQEIVGQEHVVQALVNGLESDRLHHAFLFTGTRGVGKTTLARVLAKALNCQQGVSGHPCGECQHCEEIKQGDFIDLIEVDAASRTGVDDTRSLLDNVQYAPNKGSYKIYLIDEVHMFSKSSFNALLKTLEEPPEHVKFLLATTEPDKLPVTVLSRCLQFNLKRLTQKQIGDHLLHLLKQESVHYDERAVELIARVADGSMRDALSLLDQSLAFGAGQITYDEIRGMLGTIEQTHVTELLQLIQQQEEAGVMDKLGWLHDMSVDYSHLLEDLCLLLHEVSLIQSLGAVTGGANFEAAVLKSLAAEIHPETVQWYYQLVVLALQQINITPNKKISFEMAVMRMLAFEPQTGQPGGRQRQANQTNAGQSPKANATTNNTANTQPQPTAQQVTEQPVAQVVDSSPAAPQPPPLQAVKEAAPAVNEAVDLSQLQRNTWPDVFQALKLKGTARELARNMELLENDQKVITFAVDQAANNFMTDRAKQAIEQALLAGSDKYRLQYVYKDHADSLAKESLQQKQQAEQPQNLDHVVTDLQQQFGATIIQNKLGD
ncbi:DNA polymerase III subunit gamma/tau [Marinicella meishanensis]|uniref:DNA polymerase III subunit gamma/tau n=1 Tax=Marinicella meishanensis TaxID=2873263 RepID=UPI001CBB63B3|nr:DNA polymerase III subunit gamma/tau [Marinicella sp. NBU2979]